jgi:hypothetical protein
MRLFEIEQKPNGRTEIFLDMDGVLADFFAEYAVLAGLPPGSSYRDVPPAKNDPTLNKMVGTDFFYRLPKFASADKLVAMVVKIFGGYSICSSPLRGDYENSGVQKTRWIQANLNPQPNRILIESRKERHATQPDGTPNILIDDRKDNIIKWEAAGGIGIKYQATAPKSTPIPWFNKHSDTSKKQTALQENESTNYVIGIMGEGIDYDALPVL